MLTNIEFRLFFHLRAFPIAKLSSYRGQGHFLFSAPGINISTIWKILLLFYLNSFKFKSYISTPLMLQYSHTYQLSSNLILCFQIKSLLTSVQVFLPLWISSSFLLESCLLFKAIQVNLRLMSTCVHPCFLYTSFRMYIALIFRIYDYYMHSSVTPPLLSSNIQ